MVAGAHRDARGVEHLADIVRVDALNGEGQDPEPVAALGRPQQFEAGHLVDPRQKSLR